MDDLSALTIMSLLAISLVVLLAIRTLWVLRSIHTPNPNPSRRTKSISTLVVLGSGGHTTEILHLLHGLDITNYTPLSYVVATTDTTSIRRAEANKGRQPDHIYKIPRSREVGQSYWTSSVTTLWSFIFAIGLVLRVRPGLLLCNGPGTCLPIAVATFVFRIFGLCEGQIVFVESFCRVTSLSLTGKLLYPIVDLFVVHWKQLKTLYPKSHLVSTFVPHSKTSPTTGRK